MEAVDQGCPNFFKGGQFRSHQNTREIYFRQYYDLTVFDTVKTLLFILIHNLWHTIAVFCFLPGRFVISGSVKGIQICTIQPLHQPLYWFSYAQTGFHMTTSRRPIWMAILDNSQFPQTLHRALGVTMEINCPFPFTLLI